MANNKTAKQFEEVTDIELVTTNDNVEIAPVVNLEQVMSKNGSFLNTVNMTNDEGKIAVLNAINSAISLKEAKDTVLDVCDCITMPGTRKGRNGMPDTECQNTYLIDTEGNAWFTQSDGIARSVRSIAMLYPDFGKSRTDGCLHVRVDERQLANGNTIKNLVIDA